jgi:putative membrane-bound dehydrogenase-like protein
MRSMKTTLAFSIGIAGVLCILPPVTGEIAPATDGPKPLSPEEAARTFRVPPGFRMELLAAEPLITEPSGAAWDERGQLYVCELHGYNLEGQFDIEALNKTGQLDREVRRIQANDDARKAAEAGTFGTVKKLVDTDGDGRMDKATVFADRLPPAYGIVAARGGIIVACAPDVIYLADRDGDGVAEFREALFTGFKTGALERGINAPQWGPDNWIYFGSGWGAGTITGPHLKEAVQIGRTDFRIRSDGSAIEPVLGSTHTFGFAFTADGERFVSTTSTPGLYVTPLPWHYLARNPDVAAPNAQHDAGAGSDKRVYPSAPPHPWRSRRAQDPGFFKFYRDRYGAGDSDAGGWFTSACGPLVHQDDAWPVEFRGQYFVCEPAGNLVHRAIVAPEGALLRLRRAPGEEKSEFLASSDQWFHPIHLLPTPDGAICIVDFYREIIEDYSAIPRYLQQQYGLVNGRERGRLWRLVHETAPKAPSANLAALANAALAGELANPYVWRRQTARRVLIERGAKEAASAVAALLAAPKAPVSAALSALYTIEGLDVLGEADLLAGLEHTSPEVRRHALRLADVRFEGAGKAIEALLLSGKDFGTEPRLLLQIALSLGQSRDQRAAGALARIAHDHGDVRWMDAAIASSSHQREKEILAVLLRQPGRGTNLLESLAAIVAHRGDTNELRATRKLIAEAPDSRERALVARIIDAGLAEAAAPPAKTEPLPPPQAPDKELLAQVDAAVPRFVAALTGKRDLARGRELFREHCEGCHVARGMGVAVGPDLDGENKRAEQTILRDILFPSEVVRPGYETYHVEARRGQTYQGILVSESPTSLTLRIPSGDEITLLRKSVRRSKSYKVSLMPSYAQTLEPRDVADLIAFLRDEKEARR